MDESQRGNGHGTALVEYVENWAGLQECASIGLASPLAKEDIHEYYDGLGYDTWGVAIEKRL